MAEYIEKEEIVDLLSCREAVQPEQNEFDAGFKAGMKCAIQIVSLFGGEDIAPVVHGKWDKNGSYDSIGGDWMKSQQCSVCYALYVSPGNTPWEHHKYCPNCGAKMDGEE